CVFIALFFGVQAVSATSPSDKPCNDFFLIKASSDVNGTSVGYNSVIVCPHSFAQIYPSPVDPVLGTDLLPEAKITFFASISSPISRNTPCTDSSLCSTCCTRMEDFIVTSKSVNSSSKEFRNVL